MRAQGRSSYSLTDNDPVEADESFDQVELLRQVEAITSIGYFINDEKTDKNLYISPGYAQIHGRSVEEFQDFVESCGDNLAGVHDEDREVLRAKIIDYVENADDEFELEYRVTHPDGKSIWVRERSIAQSKEDGKVRLTLGVLQDITQEKEYEKSLQQAKDLLEITVKNRTRELADTITQLKSEIAEREKISHELETKNAELERFAYTVSHDLKTPLVTIKGFLGLLEKDVASNDTQSARDDISKINQAADTMVKLLEDLLELSRIGRVVGDVEPLPLGDIVRRALATVETRTREGGIEVEVGDLPPVMGDETRLIEVYQNLLENSIKFLGNQANPKIEIGSQKRDGRICLFVRDNGIGIDDEYHDLVFGLFERLNLDIEGTGVGLALVKRIIEVHGGRIWIESD